ncbi:MAG: DUF3570 domain-containing protein, partial [Candidatus Latescibacterota bacterium]
MSCGSLWAQQLPENEVQVNFSSYFDSFDVSIVYPSVSLTKKVSESTSVTGRYLVDMVSAASIKYAGTTSAEGSVRQVDTVTSASGRRGGEGEELFQFDDVRHELGLGLTQVVGLGTVSFNGIYSKENDYSSATIASTLSQSFAKKNTTIGLGVVRSWDKVFPSNQTWTRNKDVTTLSANVSQVLNTRMVAQVLGSYRTDKGYLADAYQQVLIGGQSFDPVHPDQRIQKALAGRLKFRLNDQSSLQLGYRYYWDDWDMTSHTGSLDYKRYVSSNIILGLGLRSYVQNQSYFFK